MVIAGIPFTMPAVWIGLIVIFLVIEGLTAGLVTIWFAAGALAALIAAMFHAPLWLQLRRRKGLDGARTGRRPHCRRNDRYRAAHRRRQAHRHTRLRACRRK